MTHFYTCIGCKRKGNCTPQNDLKDSIRGFNISFVKHRCQWRAPIFEPGDPVLIRTRVDNNYGDEGQEPPVADFPGHFVEQKYTKAICFIAPMTLSVGDDEPYPFCPMNGGTGYVKVPLSRIQADASRSSVEITKCSKCLARTTFVDECWCANMADCA